MNISHIQKDMKYTYIYIILLFAFCSVVPAYPQQDIKQTNTIVKDYTDITLPPLDLLFENAKKGPIYRGGEVKAEIERRLLAKEKKAFLSYFSLRGSYQYGMYGNEGTYTNIATSPVLSYTTQAQVSYTVGIGLNIPINEIFDLKGRVRRQKLSVLSKELERDAQFEELQKEIIELYSTATSQLQLLKTRAEALELATLQYQIAEKDFGNGAIDSGTLAQDKQRQSTAQEAFEGSRLELTKSLMILEVVTHTSILNKKDRNK